MADDKSRTRLNRQSGFTILEIVVVVALMGLIATIAGPRIGSGMRGAETKTSVRRFAAALRAARMIAVAQRAQILVVAELGGNQCEFRIRSFRRQAGQGVSDSLQSNPDSKEGTISELFEKPLELAGDVRFLRFVNDQNTTTVMNDGYIMFLPQGNSTGGTFILGREGGPYYEVTIDPVTGRVHMNPSG